MERPRRPRVPRKASSKPPVLKISEDDFEKDKALGSGAFGDVYTGLWNSSKGQVKVAVKYFNSKLIGKDSNFDRELNVLSCVYNHQNIVDLFGFGDNGLKQFMVMELAPFSMDDVLHKLKDPQFIYYADHVMHWALQLVDGMHFIHSQQIIHRDIKPSNLLLFEEGTLLKMCDFGTAKMLQTATAANTFIGTALYLAPEIAKGPHDNKCDIFSFAITLWEMLTRHRPMLQDVQMEQMSMLAIVMQIERGNRPPKVQGIPKFLSQLLDACWAPSPPDRPTAEQLVSTLRNVCKHFESGWPLIDPTKPDAHSNTVRRVKTERKKPSASFARGVSFPQSQQELDYIEDQDLYTQPLQPLPTNQEPGGTNQGVLQNTNAAVDDGLRDEFAYVQPPSPSFPLPRKATPNTPYYFPGVEDEFQPYVPVEDNPESMEVYSQYKLYLEQNKKVVEEIQSLQLQSTQLSADIEEERRKAEKYAETQEKNSALLKEREKLEEELRHLKQTYRSIELEIHRDHHLKK